MVIDLEETNGVDVDAGIANWENFPVSYLSHHGAACCEIAREWITGMDFSQLNAGHPLTGPRWLRKLFKWGPSKWPMHWCEAVQEKTLDCGALGALSHEMYLARGVRSFPAQFILEFNDVSTRHWTETWGAAGSCAPWISEGLIYHEGCAVAVDVCRASVSDAAPEAFHRNALQRKSRADATVCEIKLWDATATWWINPKQFGGYAGLLAVRVFDKVSETPATFSWGEHRIPANTWHKVERATADFAARKAAPKPRRKRAPRAAKKVVEPTVAA